METRKLAISKSTKHTQTQIKHTTRSTQQPQHEHTHTQTNKQTIKQQQTTSLDTNTVVKYVRLVEARKGPESVLIPERTNKPTNK